MADAPPLAQVLERAASAWQRVIAGESMPRAIAEAITDHPHLRPQVLDVTASAMRQRALLVAAIAQLAERKPPPPLAALLAVSIGQLLRDRHADYTVVDQAVTAARQSGAGNATGFVNAVLRRFLRQRESLVDELRADDRVRYNAPAWWLKRLQQAHPTRWRDIAAAATEMPPLVLRVNRRRTDVEGYMQQLSALGIGATRVGISALWLHRPSPVDEVPGFAAGEVSVQDAGAQLAAHWLDVSAGARVLDACAAPGGKTAHLTELADLDLTALEIDPERARRIEDNLERVGGAARVITADAALPADWWDGRRFDRVLLDAPCTASGIVRRHPDIPWLRRPADVAHLATQQARLLDALWPLVGTGGRLLYVVCSVFPDEGRKQIERFLARTPDAHAVPLLGLRMVELVPTPVAALPWEDGSAVPTLHDGFFYAMLEKVR